MDSSTNAKLSGRTWFVIVMIAACGQIAWAIENNFFNLFIQDAFGASLNDVALMVSASALTATITTLFVGAWSDRRGKRKLFICLGYILWGASVLVFAELQRISTSLAGDVAAAASLGIALTIVFDCVMTFFGSGANDACFNAWVTDITNDENRGKVEGVNSAMPLLSMLVVFGGAMFLMYTDDAGVVTYDYHTFFLIIGAVVIAVGIASFFLLDESHPEPNREGGYMTNCCTASARRSSSDIDACIWCCLVTWCSPRRCRSSCPTTFCTCACRMCCPTHTSWSWRQASSSRRCSPSCTAAAWTRSASHRRCAFP